MSSDLRAQSRSGDTRHAESGQIVHEYHSGISKMKSCFAMKGPWLGPAVVGPWLPDHVATLPWLPLTSSERALDASVSLSIGYGWFSLP